MSADCRMVSALRQAGSPLVPSPPWMPERLVAPPREHKPDPGCGEGGPHRYPPGPDALCKECGVGPSANAVAGLGRIAAQAKLAEAFG